MANREYLKAMTIITTNRGRKETTMANKRLWRQVVNDYYNEANFYLVTEA